MPRYVWFPATTVQALRQQLDAASPEAVLVVRGEAEHMTLEVVEPGRVFEEDALSANVLNESHICPPFCI